MIRGRFPQPREAERLARSKRSHKRLTEAGCRQAIGAAASRSRARLGRAGWCDGTLNYVALPHGRGENGRGKLDCRQGSCGASPVLVLATLE